MYNFMSAATHDIESKAFFDSPFSDRVENNVFQRTSDSGDFNVLFIAALH